MQGENNLRADKNIRGLGSFSNEILVKCPHCNKKAKVLTQLGTYTIPFPSSDTKSIFRCNNCYKPINEKDWYGPVFIYPDNKKCGYCGTNLHFAEKVDKKKDTIEVKCLGCEQEKKYNVSYRLTYANSKQATDPYFGLQLWLQTAIDTNIFWAFNYEHLDYLEKYVSAKLREKNIVSNYSITQTLPDFIKLAKNRNKILKTIERQRKIDFEPA